jgi:hypothetical protein
MSNNNLPTLADLNTNIEQAFKNDQLNYLLNQEPPAAWVKTNKYAGNTSYIPIDKVEMLLTRIFQEWRVEVLDVKQLFNAVSCHIRLHYKNPTNGEWSYHDGVGAMQIQTKSGASPADLGAINNNAVMMAVPAAKSYAIKDAADHLGKLFGRDLNRKDTMAFTPAYDNELKQSINEKLKSKYGTEATSK